MSGISRRLTVCISWAALLGLIAAMLLIASWFLGGGRVYSVPTGSMRPVIQPGDAVFTKSAGFSQLRAGQIVSFRDRTQPSLITTHRIISIDRAAGSLTTKGDHNPEPDLPISRRQVIGQATMVSPGLGRVLVWLRRPIGLLLAAYVPILAIMYLELSRLLRRRAIYQGR